MPSSPTPPLPARLPKPAVARTYAWIAPMHDVLARRVAARARGRALSWLDVRDGESILEVGVGTGLSFERLLRQNPNGWTEGVDLAPAMLRRAKRRARRAPTDRYDLRVGDAYDLGAPDATFDGVLNSYMFDLLPADDFVPVLREFRRVLRPGGRLVQINMTKSRCWHQQGWEWLYRCWPPLLGGCRCVEMAPFFEEAGFEAVRRRFLSEWTFPSEVVYGIKPPD